MQHLRKIALCLLLLSGLLLSACGAAGQPGSASEYTVKFYDGSVLVREEVVAAGELPESFVPDLEGRRFLGWQTGKGETADPFTTAADRDMSYTVLALPALRTHVPYLFMDENGFVYPDDALSADDFALALKALGGEPGEKLPSGAEPAPAEEIRAALLTFFTEEELAAFPATGTVSRTAFAQLMNALLGQGGEEHAIPAEGALAPVDLAADHAAFADVLEASVPHEPGGELTWQEAAPETGYAPGARFVYGKLYWCGEDGRLLRKAEVEGLAFGEDGLYTCGDEELDTYVTEILALLCDKYPEDANDRLAMLRHVYDYAIANFHYVGRSTHSDEEGWELRDGKVMLETGKGDCYNYTAGFTVLARGLGYPATPILRALDGNDLHAWTDIVIDGTPYIFDPQLEKHFKNNRFMLTYKQGEGYGYRRPFDTPGEVPEAFQDLTWNPPTQLGELVSTVGEDGLTYLVYLPVGYDESKQYNVLVYLYGADGDPYKILGTANTYSHQNRYLGHYITTPAFIEFLAERGECEGVIFAAVNTAMTDGQSDRYLRLLQYTVDNFSTYAESSSLEDLIAARDHFGIAGPSSAAQSICLAIQEMPDVFGCFGLFSGMIRTEATLECLSQKQDLSCVVVGVGEQEYRYKDMLKAYERIAAMENVKHAYLATFPDSEHEWSAFDGALRELLIHFKG